MRKENTKLIEGLKEEITQLLKDKADILEKTEEIDAKISMCKKMLEEMGSPCPEVLASSHKLSGINALLKAMYRIKKGTKPQIKEALKTYHGYTEIKAENACRNHLSTLVNQGKLKTDNSGVLRVYILNKK